MEKIKEIRCHHCSVTIKGYRKNRKLCKRCRIMSHRWAGKRFRVRKEFGLDIGGFENCERC